MKEITCPHCKKKFKIEQKKEITYLDQKIKNINPLTINPNETKRGVIE